ncbi:hypothetical protein [Rathayibacter toxicus]|uniref:hypothetical protein n=1 Tax=Rathayibacter toxicus TaxID=145458 RepID=UPI001C046539|nr:hypothetical protein [Rathayibacter toxicus]QWL31436.1 hypothetical protein E2R35_00240 [Rathayibacter toxicus]QWL33527.1 hypothetical protein E2R36_00240 [Rathayibacter toxicus]QWL35662.1 hypothetical protein E2R37_00240 [Rathayibacter toxicus]QWL37751.1 hypothetical protein E2R38_00240 [Rathayibacter toxicus]QWL39841.1 hypothetical protein E2R39_00240 [Rathayibacter toxicus]
MLREVIPVRGPVRDAGIALLVLSAVSGYGLLRAGLGSQSIGMALSWVPLCIPFLVGFFLASSKVMILVEDGWVRARLIPLGGVNIPAQDVICVKEVMAVQFSDRWRYPGSRTVALPCDRGPGIEITTRTHKVYRIRTDRAAEFLCR